MTEAERKFREDRALRNAAHSLVKAQTEQVRRDLAEKGIGQRVADKASDQAKAVVDHSLEVASSHRGIVAGTVAALLLWLFRNPLIAGGKHLWGSHRESEPEPQPEPEPEPWWRRLRSGGDNPKEPSQ